MRIAYFCDGDDNHGFRWIQYHAVHHEVIVICNEVNTLDFYKDVPGIPCYPVLPKVYPLRNVLLRNKVLAAVKGILLKHNSEVLHSMYAVPYAIWAGELNLPNHIVTTRGSDMLVEYRSYLQEKRWKQMIVSGWMRRKLEKVMNRADYITSTSSSQQEVIRSFISDPKKMYRVRTGVDTQAFLGELTGLIKKETRRVILSNRAMSATYNIDLIVDAFNLLLTKAPDAGDLHLALIDYNGTASYSESIRNKIENLGIGKRVTIYVECQGRALVQLYTDACLVVMMPKSDGTPVSAIEAMLSSRPLIIPPIRYDEDLFYSDTIWKTASFNSSDLCDTMLAVLQTDLGEKNKKIEAAYQAAITFADTRIEMTRMDSLYRSLQNK